MRKLLPLLRVFCCGGLGRGFGGPPAGLTPAMGSSTKMQRRRLPSEYPTTNDGTTRPKLLVSYATNTDEAKILDAVEDGVNVICWFAADLRVVENATTGQENKDSETRIVEKLIEDSDSTSMRKHHHRELAEKEDTEHITKNKSNKQYSWHDIRIDFRPEVGKVAKIALEIQSKYANRHVRHLVVFGGWNAPHIVWPSTMEEDLQSSLTGEDFFRAFDVWNRDIVSRGEYGWDGFDGIDWDWEGHDNRDAATSIFSRYTLDVMGQMSVAAKKAGYIVAMAPAQSYLDPRCCCTRPGSNDLTGTGSLCDFSFSLKLPPAPVKWHPEFKHQGRNCYAYALGKYGKTVLDEHGAGGNDYAPSDELTTSGVPPDEGHTQDRQVVVDTFDFVSLQLYETNSLALYETHNNTVDVGSYLSALASDFSRGFRIRIPSDSEEDVTTITNSMLQQEQEKQKRGHDIISAVQQSQRGVHLENKEQSFTSDESWDVSIDTKTQLVWGFSFGPKSREQAFYFDHFRQIDWSEVAGAMFWEIALDKTGFENETERDPSKWLHMAKGLHDAMTA
ncbi:unnamed protein product [Amoebophrya sp. A25]|nr:unnamed protein product [Amoebophrya sp. A25]|eukprot:GSA25T00011095001.1